MNEIEGRNELRVVAMGSALEHFLPYHYPHPVTGKPWAQEIRK
jgi:hypothetical protein